MTTGDFAFRGVLVAGGLLLLGLIGGPGIEGANRDLHDRLVRLKSERMPVEDVPFVLISIDDASVAELGRFPWDRAVLARVTERLTSLGAAAIGFDILLSEAASPAGDSAFATALARAPSTVLATTPSTAAGPGLRPIAAFSEQATRLGAIAVTEDSDGVLRHYPFLTESEGEILPSLAAALIEAIAANAPPMALNADGSIPLNWASMSPASVDRISVVELLSNRDPQLANRVGGKAALVAATYTGGVDEGPTPLAARLPYVYAHLFAAQTALTGRTEREVPGWLPLAATLLAIVLLTWGSAALHPLRLALGVPLGAGGLVGAAGLLFLTSGIWLPPVFPAVAILLFGAGYGIMAWRTHLDARRRAESFLRRFVGKDLEVGTTTELHSQRAEVTILFWDLCDFTSFANNAGDQDVVDVLRTFGSCILDTIEAHGGVIDKLLGDGVMAFWGFPDDGSNHAAMALKAATAMRTATATANRAIEARGFESFQARTGIATGRVIVGEIGSATRADFTLIGRTVNLAARLCEAAEPDQILISAPCRELAGGQFRDMVDSQEPLMVKGFDEPVDVYQLSAERMPLISGPATR